MLCSLINYYTCIYMYMYGRSHTVHVRLLVGETAGQPGHAV